jgi:MSHA biogenesis protein MshI
VLTLFKKRHKEPGGQVIISLDGDGYGLVYADCQAGPVIKEKQLFSKDEAGEKSLETYIKKHALIHARTTLILPPQDYRLLVIDAPQVPQEEYAQAAKWLVKDLIDFPLSEAAIDTFPVPDRAGQATKLCAVITHLPTLQARIFAFECLGLQVVSVDITELALVRLLSDETAPVAMLYAGGDALRVMIVSDGILDMVRNKEINLVANCSADDFSNDETLILELQRSFDFYQTQKNKPVQKLIIAPSLKMTKAQLAHLNTQLNLTVETMDAGAFSDDGWSDHVTILGELKSLCEPDDLPDVLPEEKKAPPQKEEIAKAAPQKRPEPEVPQEPLPTVNPAGGLIESHAKGSVVLPTDLTESEDVPDIDTQDQEEKKAPEKREKDNKEPDGGGL